MTELIEIKPPTIEGALSAMIQRMTPNTALQEDLAQEAKIHLWLTEARRPGQTRSWYLQSCRFHLQHYLNSGRSIDSARRWRDQSMLEESAHENEEIINELTDPNNSVFSGVCAREIMSLLKARLSAAEQAVLDCLADGLGVREIGRQLKLSHPTVIRHRRRIASLFIRLESGPHINQERRLAGNKRGSASPV